MATTPIQLARKLLLNTACFTAEAIVFIISIPSFPWVFKSIHSVKEHGRKVVTERLSFYYRSLFFCFRAKEKAGMKIMPAEKYEN